MSGEEKIHVIHLSPSLLHRAFAYIWGLLPISEDLIALGNSEHSTERKCVCNLDDCAWQKPCPSGGCNDLQRTSEHKEAGAGCSSGATQDLAGTLAQFTDG